MNSLQGIALWAVTTALVLSWAPICWGQLIQLTFDPEVIYLPEKYQMQVAASLDDGRFLVVWGTTRKDADGSLGSRLIFQFVDSTGPIDSPRTLTSDIAHPQDSIFLVPYSQGCFILWLDVRSGSEATYSRYLDYESGEVSEEWKLAERPVQSVMAVDTLPQGRKRFLCVMDTASYCYIGDGVRQPSLHASFEQGVLGVLSLDNDTYHRLLVLADSTMCPVSSGDVVDPYTRISRERTRVPVRILSDGSVWVQQGSDLYGYRFWWSTEPDTVVRLSGDVGAGVIFGGVRGDSLLLVRVSSYTDTTSFAAEEFTGRFHLDYHTEVLIHDSVVARRDSVRIYEYFPVFRSPRNGGEAEYRIGQLDPPVMIEDLNIPAGVELQVRLPYRVQIESKWYSGETTHRFELKLDPVTTDVSVTALPRRNEGSDRPAVRRIWDDSLSTVEVQIGSHRIRSAVEAAWHYQNLPVRMLGSYERDGALSISYYHGSSYVQGDTAQLGVIQHLSAPDLKPVGLDSSVSVPIRYPLCDNEGQAGELVSTAGWSGFTVDQIGNYVVANTWSWRRDRFEQIPHGTSSPAWTGRSRFFRMGSVHGYRKLGSLLADLWEEVGVNRPPAPHRSEYGWDPNSDELYILANWARFDRDPTWAEFVAVDRTGAVRVIDTTRVDLTFEKPHRRFIPVGDSTILVVTDSLLLSADRVVVTRFHQPIVDAFSQRVYGDRFIRAGYSEGEYHLEIYSLKGELLESGSTDSIGIEGVVTGGKDSLIVHWVLQKDPGELHLYVYNQELVASDASPVRIPLEELDSIHSLRGQFINDRLYLVFAGRFATSGREEVFVTSTEVPEVPALKNPVQSVPGDREGESGRSSSPHQLDLTGTGVSSGAIRQSGKRGSQETKRALQH